MSVVRQMPKQKPIIPRINRPIQPLPILVRNSIIELIQKGIYAPGDKMPVEPELAANLGVSRATLREALRLLEEDGFILRRAGVGTFVRWLCPPAASNSLEKNFGTLEVMKSMGFSPEIIQIETRVIKADHIMSEILKVEIGCPLVFRQSITKVGERKIVYGMNILAQSILEGRTLGGFKKSLCGFLEKECHQEIAYGIAKVIPAVADELLSRELEIDTGSPLFLIEQVNYDSKSQPVFFSRDYWVKGIVEFTIFRDRRKSMNTNSHPGPTEKKIEECM